MANLEKAGAFAKAGAYSEGRQGEAQVLSLSEHGGGAEHDAANPLWDYTVSTMAQEAG